MKELVKVLVNSILAGLLVTFGALSTGHPNLETLYFAIIAGVLISIKQLQDYFKDVKTDEGQVKLLTLI